MSFSTQIAVSPFRRSRPNHNIRRQKKSSPASKQSYLRMQHLHKLRRDLSRARVCTSPRKRLRKIYMLPESNRRIFPQRKAGSRQQKLILERWSIFLHHLNCTTTSPFYLRKCRARTSSRSHHCLRPLLRYTFRDRSPCSYFLQPNRNSHYTFLIHIWYKRLPGP